ncbi:MAG: hypothetical protein Q7T83_11280 [Thermodesulfovibrionales bacterium]|nr:hypothetical protein [Thermodesulfovibrionales bacterium]
MKKDRLRLRLRLRKKLKNIFFISTLTLACLFSYSLAQTPQDIPVGPVKSVMKIEVNDGLLSVEISDAEFGNVIKEIAEKAKFKAEISSDVALKKISTTFKDIEVERGVRRLLTIMKEKDFTISYNTAGLIDKLEIYGGGVISRPVGNPQKNPARQQRPFQQRVTPPSPLPPPTTLPQ